MKSALAVIVALVAFCSLYGWGRLTGKMLKYRPASAAESVAVGLAAFIAAGGAINAAGIGYGWVIDGMLALGLAVTVLSAYKALPTGRVRYDKDKAVWIVLSVIAVLLVAFVTAPQFPPSAFNYHDDFEKYFTHPMRMLQTGTLFGSPLSAVGSETLGGQAVLHAAVAHHFPLPYINAVDGVFGLLLCLFIVASAIPAGLSLAPVFVTGVACIVVINPLMINSSAIFTGSALVAASFLPLSGLHDDVGKRYGQPLVLGLIYASLIALKSSFIAFVVILLAVYPLVAFFTTGCMLNSIRFSCRTALSTLLFLSPWLLLHAPHYFSRSRATLQPFAGPAAGETFIQHVGFLSLESSFYGPSYAHYTWLAAATLIFSGMLLWVARQAPEKGPPSGVAASGIAAALSYLGLVWLGPRLNGYDASLRFSVPMLVAAAPISAAFLLKFCSTNYRTRIIAVVLAIQLSVIVAFSGDFIERMQQASSVGNTLAFSGLASSEPFLSYNRMVLSDQHRLRIRRIQEVVPPGAPMVAWITTPFLLDFSRNKIFDAEHAGIGNPWSYVPAADYFMIEYDGYAVTPMTTYYEDLQFPGKHEQFVSRKVLTFVETLHQLQESSQQLYDDGQVVVFKRKL